MRLFIYNTVMETEAVLTHLTKKQLEIIQKYGKRNGLLATTGRKVGQVNRSAVIRKAIEYLPAIEKLQNGGKK